MEHIFVVERSHLPWVSKKSWKILTWSIGHGRKIMIEDSLTMKNSPFTTIFIMVDGHFSSSVRMATMMNSALATSTRRMRSWRCGLTYSHCQTKRMQHCCLFQDGVPAAERHPSTRGGEHVVVCPLMDISTKQASVQENARVLMEANR
jgi:hypothetical protein